MKNFLLAINTGITAVVSLIGFVGSIVTIYTFTEERSITRSVFYILSVACFVFFVFSVVLSIFLKKSEPHPKTKNKVYSDELKNKIDSLLSTYLPNAKQQLSNGQYSDLSTTLEGITPILSILKEAFPEKSVVLRSLLFRFEGIKKKVWDFNNVSYHLSYDISNTFSILEEITSQVSEINAIVNNQKSFKSED